MLGREGSLIRDGKHVDHNKVDACEVAEIYAGHEVAVHTLTHPSLPLLEEAEIIRQVEENRKNLEQFVGYDVVGMAYPGGGVNFDERVANIIRNKTKIQYCRTTLNTNSFEPQSDLYQFKPTVYHIMEQDRLFLKAKEFIDLKPDRPQIFYIWGHSYEMDFTHTWNVLEDFLKLISGKEDIFYGTNREVLLGK